MDLSKEYIEFSKTLKEETKGLCSKCKRPLYDCYCNRVHPSFAHKVPKAGNPDNVLDYGNILNIKINKSLLEI